MSGTLLDLCLSHAPRVSQFKLMCVPDMDPLSHLSRSPCGSNTPSDGIASVVKDNVGGSVLRTEVDDGSVPGSLSRKRVVSVVTLEDLLWRMPLDQRPKIRVGAVDAVTGALAYTLVPLQPEHVYLVKCDVEGFDTNVMHRFGCTRTAKWQRLLPT